jgi:microcompartment protein PduB
MAEHIDDKIIEKALQRVAAEIKSGEIKTGEKKMSEINAAANSCKDIGVPEFIGTAIGDTIGLLIASIDPLLIGTMGMGKFHSIGMISSRVGLCPQCMAVDDAIKATNAEVISIEAVRDGGAGQGSLIYIGAEDVSDAKRCVEIALASMDKYFGDVYINNVGHLDMQYTARASYCLEKGFGAKLGKAFGVICAAPAAIGTVLSDIAVKAANVDVISYTSPSQGPGYSFSNEVTLTITGDSGAVRQAVRAAIEVGKKLLGAMGEEPKSSTTPYI